MEARRRNCLIHIVIFEISCIRHILIIIIETHLISYGVSIQHSKGKLKKILILLLDILQRYGYYDRLTLSVQMFYNVMDIMIDNFKVKFIESQMV